MSLGKVWKLGSVSALRSFDLNSREEGFSLETQAIRDD